MARKRVLIVEDETTLRSVIREVLEQFGYEAAEAGDGSEGVARAEHFRPDVILLDIILPGLDGYEVCRRLKANPATTHIPVVFITGMEGDTLYEAADAVGAVASITKPFHCETLVAVIAAALAGAERQATPSGQTQ